MQSFRNDRSGASFIGYGLAVGLISVVALVAVQGTGSKVAEIFGGAGNSLIAPQAGSGGNETPNQPPVITASSLPAGQAGEVYSQTLTATDADGPGSLTWSIASGALPSGLTLDAGTGEIAGTPDTVENASFTVEVSDGADTASQAISIEIQGLFASCLEILNANPSTPSGVHQIDIGGEAMGVYCDMDSAGGGWTMVAAMFEADTQEVAIGLNWNEGIQDDYDPSLASSKSFSLNASELPSHTQLAFGKDTDADFVEWFDFVYSTGDIPKTTIYGKGKRPGSAYHIHRSLTAHYTGSDPDHRNGLRETGMNALTISLTPNPSSQSEMYSDWTFTRGATDVRGYAMNGIYLYTSLQDYAWTVWVR